MVCLLFNNKYSEKWICKRDWNKKWSPWTVVISEDTISWLSWFELHQPCTMIIGSPHGSMPLPFSIVRPLRGPCQMVTMGIWLYESCPEVDASGSFKQKSRLALSSANSFLSALVMNSNIVQHLLLERFNHYIGWVPLPSCIVIWGRGGVADKKPQKPPLTLDENFGKSFTLSWDIM